MTKKERFWWGYNKGCKTGDMSSDWHIAFIMNINKDYN